MGGRRRGDARRRDPLRAPRRHDPPLRRLSRPLPARLRGSTSTHAVGVGEAIELARALGRLPRAGRRLRRRGRVASTPAAGSRRRCSASSPRSPTRYWRRPQRRLAGARPRLPVGDPAVVRRQRRGHEDTQAARARAASRASLEQQPILEDAAGQHHGPRRLALGQHCQGARGRRRRGQLWKRALTSADGVPRARSRGDRLHGLARVEDELPASCTRQRVGAPLAPRGGRLELQRGPALLARLRCGSRTARRPRRTGGPRCSSAARRRPLRTSSRPAPSAAPSTRPARAGGSAGPPVARRPPATRTPSATARAPRRRRPGGARGADARRARTARGRPPGARRPRRCRRCRAPPRRRSRRSPGPGCPCSARHRREVGVVVLHPDQLHALALEGVAAREVVRVRVVRDHRRLELRTALRSGRCPRGRSAASPSSSGRRCAGRPRLASPWPGRTCSSARRRTRAAAGRAAGSAEARRGT